MSVTAFAFALIVAAPLAQPVSAHFSSPAQMGDLAAQPLAAGREDQAIAVLEKATAANPHDAAVLINLGIAYAQAGDDVKARAAFDAALACHEVIELETADGSITDSRRLTRKAIKMLEQGEFRPAESRSGQMTYRD